VTATGRPRHRRVAVITGTRAEYGVLRSVMQAIDGEPSLSLQVVVTGAHLLRKFGHTVDEVEGDGWPIAARIPMQAGTDHPLDQAQGLARGVAGIARFLERAATDIVVVLGDRIEALAGALAAVTTGRVLAHIHGGDVAPGDFDDGLRHAITKLAHVHFAATRRAARRIIRMGERPEHVYVVGAPGLDRLRELIAEEPVARARPGLALIVQHPCGRPPAVEERAMTALLRAVRSLGLRRLILYPNTDRGHSGILWAIRRHLRESPDRGRAGGVRAASPAVQVVRSLPRDDYLRALLQAAVLVGNSSSGIIEAPLARTSSVNVGMRQAGREPGGSSIVHAKDSEGSIREALHRALRNHARLGGRSVYGDGRAGQRIARILSKLRLTLDLVKKQIRY
jgi:GDP/UDP-N,N'-diacetylbacillosamine 2-epimerase (hydrolysing)